MRRHFCFSSAGRSVAVLFVALAVFAACAWARGSASSSVEEDRKLMTAADYEGEDLELFEAIVGTTWCPKAKGFAEVTNPFVFISKKSERVTFRESGEVWFKYGSTGAVIPYYIRDGMIVVEGYRFAYDAETDRITDLVGGRVYTRVGDKPEAAPASAGQADGTGE